MRRKIARVFGVTLLLLSFLFLWGSKEIPVKAADIAENEKAEGNADANTSEEPSDEAEEANETAEGESEEKNDGSEN